MKNKIIITLIFCFSFLFLSGCVNVEMNENVLKNGVVNMDWTFTTYNEYAMGYLEEALIDLKDNKDLEVISIDNGYKVRGVLNDDKYEFKKTGIFKFTYTYNQENTLNDLDPTYINGRYVINMPGKIIDSGDCILNANGDAVCDINVDEINLVSTGWFWEY